MFCKNIIYTEFYKNAAYGLDKDITSRKDGETYST